MSKKDDEIRRTVEAERARVRAEFEERVEAEHEKRKSDLRDSQSQRRTDLLRLLNKLEVSEDELVHRRRSAALGEVDATEDLEIAQSIERSRRAHLVKRMRFFFRDEIDASALTHSYREALVHIAKANVSPAMGFAKRVLDGASVAEAHRLETEELREKP